MSHHSPFHDSKAVKLLSRVGDDISQLRHDIRSLLSHTAHHTLPESAQELAERARGKLSAGGDYAAARLRAISRSPRCPDAAPLVGGVLLLAVVGFGLCLLSRKCAERRAEEEDDRSFNPD